MIASSFPTDNLKCTVKNRTCRPFNGGSLEITPTVPLKYLYFCYEPVSDYDAASPRPLQYLRMLSCTNK